MEVTSSKLFTWSRHQEVISIFCNTGWLALIYLMLSCFSFFWSCLYFILIFMGIFARHKILLWKSLFSLKMSFHCLLALIISSEESEIVFIFVSLYLMCPFPQSVFKIASLPLVFTSFTVVCLNVGFFVFILFGIYWTPWMCVSIFFIKFGEFLTIFLNVLIFLLLLGDSLSMYM